MTGIPDHDQLRETFSILSHSFNSQKHVGTHDYLVIKDCKVSLITAYNEQTKEEGRSKASSIEEITGLVERIFQHYQQQTIKEHNHVSLADLIVIKEGFCRILDARKLKLSQHPNFYRIYRLFYFLFQCFTSSIESKAQKVLDNINNHIVKVKNPRNTKDVIEANRQLIELKSLEISSEALLSPDDPMRENFAIGQVVNNFSEALNFIDTDTYLYGSFFVYPGPEDHIQIMQSSMGRARQLHDFHKDTFSEEFAIFNKPQAHLERFKKTWPHLFDPSDFLYRAESKITLTELPTEQLKVEMFKKEFIFPLDTHIVVNIIREYTKEFERFRKTEAEYKSSSEPSEQYQTYSREEKVKRAQDLLNNFLENIQKSLTSFPDVIYPATLNFANLMQLKRNIGLTCHPDKNREHPNAQKREEEYKEFIELWLSLERNILHLFEREGITQGALNRQCCTELHKLSRTSS